MARDADASLLAALAQPVVRPALFLHLGFATPHTVWTGPGTIEAAGLEFTHGFFSFSSILETLDGAQQQLQITTTGLLPDVVAAPTIPVSGTQVFSYTGSDQPWTVPEGCEEITIKAWGAGGGTDVYAGGFGGFTKATIPVTAGDQLSVIVGQGGANLTTVYGFGGTGQGVAHQHNGGGLSGVFTGTTSVSASQASRALAIAGGGGAGGWNGSSGNQGGNGNASGSGGMGTMQGRDATGNVSSGYGGGGGGYQGGASTRIWGVGGSGYATPTASNVQILGAAVNQTTVPGDDDPDYLTNIGKNNNPGLVVIEYGGGFESYDAPALVYVGALDENCELVGEPNLVFAGTVKDCAWRFGADELTVSFTLIAGTANVEANTGERYNDSTQQRRYPGDLGLEYVDAMQKTELKWGAIQV